MDSNQVDLNITPEKVAYVIIKAREFDAKVDSWNAPDASDENDVSDAILENLANDPVRTELATFIAELNDDEQAELVAIAWVGRGTFEPEEFGEALRTAREERTNPTADYLLGLPLLADYLTNGFENLGFSIDDAEDELTRGEVI
ncbi:conserved protein of unknown function [Candidatus Filomicrobium marinum]|uniref:DUF3775 domain-containing protein n=1 Tax=Candidatus Filomicrobium marinum TaxID=1608628 RepID=A0A0D6JFU8_9HYPH|nr:DUF3775 domain-containing protein [Candidatus Filomicrobium marinum]CFX28587.1 conserved protein of unknown function [Candidatus Filomicrobium marinum]CPR19711.1 conserved protein of unknown function [Candidatus Filomicrobium marinum]